MKPEANSIIRSINLNNGEMLDLNSYPKRMEFSVLAVGVCDPVCDCVAAVCDTVCDAVCDQICDQVCDTIF